MNMSRRINQLQSGGKIAAKFLRHYQVSGYLPLVSLRLQENPVVEISHCLGCMSYRFWRRSPKRRECCRIVVAQTVVFTGPFVSDRRQQSLDSRRIDFLFYEENHLHDYPFVQEISSKSWLLHFWKVYSSTEYGTKQTLYIV